MGISTHLGGLLYADYKLSTVQNGDLRWTTRTNVLCNMLDWT